MTTTTTTTWHQSDREKIICSFVASFKYKFARWLLLIERSFDCCLVAFTHLTKRNDRQTSVIPSIHPSVPPSVDTYIRRSHHLSANPSIHRCLHPLVPPSVTPTIRPCVRPSVTRFPKKPRKRLYDKGGFLKRSSMNEKKNAGKNEDDLTERQQFGTCSTTI